MRVSEQKDKPVNFRRLSPSLVGMIVRYDYAVEDASLVPGYRMSEICQATGEGASRYY